MDFIKQFIRQCGESFIEEHPMDAVDVNILDNFIDYAIERLEIAFDKVKEK